MPKVYNFSVTPNTFSGIKSGKRKFLIVPNSAIIENESKPRVGDEILMHEETPATEAKPSIITGQVCHRRITHILSEDDELKKGSVIFSVEPI